MILLSNTDCVVLCHMVDMIILWTWLICIRHKRHFALSLDPRYYALQSYRLLHYNIDLIHTKTDLIMVQKIFIYDKIAVY